MRKVAAFFTIALIAILMACTEKPTAVDTAVKILKNVTQQIEKTKSMDELMACQNTFDAAIKQLEKDFPNWKPTPEQEATIAPAAEAFYEILKSKYTEFAPKADNDSVQKN